MASGLMNASTLGLTSLPPPSPPDFQVCGHPYSTTDAITTEDCVSAVHTMPSGFDRVVWHNRADSDEQYKFPLNRTHGTCQITVFASGKWADDNDLRVSVSPYLFRQLALFVIQECVVTDQESGYITHGFQRAVNWVTDPTTNFPTNLEMPASTTYFTVMIDGRTNHASIPKTDPGNFGPLTSLEMVRELTRAAQKAPANSYLRADLELRRRYVENSMFVQEEGQVYQHAWWESWENPDLSLPIPHGNLTKGCGLNRQSAGMTNCSGSYAGTVGNVAK